MITLPDSETLIRIGGGLHFVVLIATALVPSIFDWRGELAQLNDVLRTLFLVYASFVVITIIGFGTLGLVFAAEIAAGGPLARGLAAFIAVFWLARMGVQFFVFDLGDYLTTPFLKIGYNGLTLLFGTFVLLLGAVAAGIV